MREFSNQNPYRTPTSVSSRRAPAKRNDNSRRRRVRIWLIGFLLNLPVPVVFGLATVMGAGVVGMLSCLLILMAAGVAVCLYYPRFTTVLTLGTFATALSQVMPVLHLFAGLFALSSVNMLRPLPNDGDDGLIRFYTDTFLDGFLLTALTGGVVVVVAIAVGAVLRLVHTRIQERRSDRAMSGGQ